MKKITFLRGEIFESEGRNKGPKYEAGQSYELDDDFADRWLRRGAARPYEDRDDENLAGQTVAKLKALAEEEGIALGEAVKKDDIIAVIQATRTANAAA